MRIPLGSSGGAQATDTVCLCTSVTLKTGFLSGTVCEQDGGISSRNPVSFTIISFSLSLQNQYTSCCFPTILPPSGVLKLTGRLPGPLPRPLKVMTIRLYSEKGVSPGTRAWFRSPGNVSVSLFPWFFLESTRPRRRHQLICIQHTDRRVF